MDLMGLSDSEAPTSRVPAADIPFAELFPGIEVKLLRVGERTGTYTVMTRMAPGVELPKHRHMGEVHGFTISGRWGYREYPWVAQSGDYVHEPPGSTHTLYVPDDSDEPAVVAYTIAGGLVMYDDHDELMMVEDASTILDYYLNALDSAGHPAPTAMLP